jgi:hypothetical protein
MGKLVFPILNILLLAILVQAIILIPLLSHIFSSNVFFSLHMELPSGAFERAKPFSTRAYYLSEPTNCAKV